MAPKRTAAYETLWERTEPLAPRDVATLDVAAATSACLEDLRHWYYDKGDAMYLSLPAADLFLAGLRLPEHADPVSAREIKDHYSSLRTQLKVDLHVYSKTDAKIPIPRTGAPS